MNFSLFISSRYLLGSTRENLSGKEKRTALLLSLLTGFFGGHRFYLRYKVSGILQLLLTLVSLMFIPLYSMNASGILLLPVSCFLIVLTWVLLDIIFISLGFLGKKDSANLVQVISWISIIGVAVGSMALIVILSVFNGLQSVVESLYSSFDPDVKIEAAEGKVFVPELDKAKQIQDLDEVEELVFCLEETAYLKYKESECIGVLKGVGSNFDSMTGIDKMMYDGEWLLERGDRKFAIVGYGIAEQLNIFIHENTGFLKVYMPNRKGRVSAINPSSAFKQKLITPTGIFIVSPDFDNKYVVTPLSFVQKLLSYKNNEVSSMEIKISATANSNDLVSEISTILGDQYKVRTRYQLNELIYQTNKTEKWMTYLILTFILIIATFNVMGTLTMLIIDKRKDIFILKSMGAGLSKIRNIFMSEGMLIVFIGACIGLFEGSFLCLIQIYFHLVPLSGVVVEYYPVELKFVDFLAVTGTVTFIGIFSSLLPIRFVVKRYFNRTKSV